MKNVSKLSLLIMLLSSFASADGWVKGQKIKEVGVKYGNGCVILENGEIIKMDLNSEAGKSEFSLAMAAKMADKAFEVYKKSAWDLVGGCDVGETITQHIMVRVID